VSDLTVWRDHETKEVSKAAIPQLYGRLLDWTKVLYPGCLASN